MKYDYVWLVIGVAQLAFIALVGVLQYVSRSRRVAGEGDGALRGRSVLRLASSRFWWRRMQGARVLSASAEQRDRDLIRRLLLDTHPGVQSAATSCLLRYADEELVALVIDSMAMRSAVVRLYQISVLRHHRTLVAPLLLERLHSEVSPMHLYAYIDLAEALDYPDCTERVAALSIHQTPEIRVAVAKVLQRMRGDAGVIKLLTMLRDPDWRVRAQAAHGLGGIRDARAVPELSRALTDQTWWVRFRAGLALAALGEPGRKALEAACELPDRYARDMAAFVTGLSGPSIVELSEG